MPPHAGFLLEEPVFNKPSIKSIHSFDSKGCSVFKDLFKIEMFIEQNTEDIEIT